jgi:hypothetical protein
MALDRFHSVRACVWHISRRSRAESCRAPVIRSRLRVSPSLAACAWLFRCVARTLLYLARVSARQIFRVAAISFMSFRRAPLSGLAMSAHLTNR